MRETKLKLTSAVGPDASRDRSGTEGERHGGVGVDALLEESLAPSLGDHPLRGGDGSEHQEGRDGAACEGDHLKRFKIIS